MKKVVTSLGLLLAVAPSVYAQDDSGFYMGGRFGPSFLEDACEGGANNCSDDEEIGAGLIAGYDINDWFGIEGTYDYLGRFDSSSNQNGSIVTSSGDLTAFTLAPKLNFSVTDATALYGKVGGAWWNWNGGAGDEDDISLMGAVGVDHKASEKVNLRLEFQHINDMDKGYLSGADNNFVNVGMTYHFGRTDAPEPAPVVVEEPVMEEKVVETQSFVLSEAGEVELFGFDQAALKPGAEASLQPMVDRLLQYPESTATIIGHTDSKGPEAYNQKLSVERAQTVANYFESKGVSSDRLTVEGRGESQPVATNDTKEGRAKNRRVEIISPEFVYVEQK